MLITANGLMG